MSRFNDWDQKLHSEDYLLFPENISEHLSIDELSLSKGELYTFITNKNTKVKNKHSLVAVINGTDAKTIQEVLEKIPLEIRKKVKEVSMDMAKNMGLAIKICFPNAKRVIDRFHVVKLVLDALQHLRVKYRWEAIKEENIAYKKAKDARRKYYPEVFSNGDTLKELLARSRYLLYRLEDDWTMKQAQRATILFEKYPQLKTAYKLTLFFRSIYKATSKTNARIMFDDWKQRVLETNIEEFNSAVFSIEYHLENVLNFFDHYSTNAYAESFNSKIKGFREYLRGVTDIKFFLFRLSKLFA